MLLKNVSGLTINESEHRMDLPTGGMIAIRSTHHPDLLRGAGLDLAVLDEAAFMLPQVWSQVVRPMLLERKGSALFLSTPYGRNHFWELYKLGLDPEEAEWASFHFTSYDNPLISASEIDAIRRSTPRRVFDEEYLAQFSDDSGQVFRGINAAATVDPQAAPIAGRRYVAGVDWGRDHDYTCIVIIDAETRRMVALDRFNVIGWELQRARLNALCQRWQPAVIWAEANSIGSVNIEALQAEGLPIRPFMTTAASKRQVIDSLALAVERGDLALLPDPALLGEMLSYQLQRLPSGAYRYGAPSGSHDDTVIAAALAWHGVQQPGPSIDFA